LPFILSRALSVFKGGGQGDGAGNFQKQISPRIQGAGAPAAVDYKRHRNSPKPLSANVCNTQANRKKRGAGAGTKTGAETETELK